MKINNLIKIIEILNSEFEIKNEGPSNKISSILKEAISNLKSLGIEIKPRTEIEWIKIFDKWTAKMDKLYDDKERHDATMWSYNNPAEWMYPYNDIVFQAWCEFDGAFPSWDENMIEEKLIIQ